MGFSQGQADVVPRDRSPDRATAASFGTRTFTVNPMLSTLPTLMVTAVYYAWCVYRREQRLRDRVLRERVTYLLWVLATGIDDWAA